MSCQCDAWQNLKDVQGSCFCRFWASAFGAWARLSYQLLRPDWRLPQLPPGGSSLGCVFVCLTATCCPIVCRRHDPEDLSGGMANCGPGVALGLGGEDGKEIIVTGVAVGGYAATSGKLKVGDVILQVDLQAAGKTVSEVADKLKGRQGTMVSVQVRRAGLFGMQTLIETLKREPLAAKQGEVSKAKGSPQKAIEQGGKQGQDKDKGGKDAEAFAPQMNWGGSFSLFKAHESTGQEQGGDPIFGGMLRCIAVQAAGVGIVVAKGSTGIFVKSISPSGPAGKSGLLRVNDVILEVGR